MTQEDKDLLFKDLCARLPYGVKVLYDTQIFEVQYIEPMYGELKLLDNETYTLPIEEVKPYLFPLSSMTNKQKKELADICNCTIYITDWKIMFPSYEDSNMDNWQKVLDWCYKNHYDINGLIPMGLANDATGLNIY